MVKKFIIDEVKTNSELLGITDYQTSNQEDLKLKNYITISKEDKLPKNLEINYISNNWKVAQFLNKIL